MNRPVRRLPRALPTEVELAADLGIERARVLLVGAADPTRPAGLPGLAVPARAFPGTPAALCLLDPPAHAVGRISQWFLGIRVRFNPPLLTGRYHAGPFLFVRDLGKQRHPLKAFAAMSGWDRFVRP